MYTHLRLHFTSILCPSSSFFQIRFWYLTCLDWSLNQYKFLVFVCMKFLPKNINFITLLSVLQLKSASNSLLIFAGSYQDKRACCPIPCTTHPQTTPLIVVTISFFLFSLKYCKRKPKGVVPKRLAFLSFSLYFASLARLVVISTCMLKVKII
jgi:hypothetical protein